MDENQLSPFRRFLLAFVALFLVLFDRAFAEEVERLRRRRRVARTGLPAEEAKAAAKTDGGHPNGGPAPAQGRSREQDPSEALHLLSIFQRDGRLVDFLSEDLNGFSDSEIGAAARTVHEGCRKALDAYVALEPVFREPEGALITVPAGFDPSSVRLTGNVVGQPPFQGSLRHHGWRVARVTLPQAGPADRAIIAPAEVEL
jgi:hypothetical protein